MLTASQRSGRWDYLWPHYFPFEPFLRLNVRQEATNTTIKQETQQTQNTNTYKRTTARQRGRAPTTYKYSIRQIISNFTYYIVVLYILVLGMLK